MRSKSITDRISLFVGGCGVDAGCFWRREQNALTAGNHLGACAISCSYMFKKISPLTPDAAINCILKMS
jgi:hypothetical protein